MQEYRLIRIFLFTSRVGVVSNSIESMGAETKKKLSSMNPMNHTFYSDYNSDIVSGGGVLSGDSRSTSEINLKQSQQKKTKK